MKEKNLRKTHRKWYRLDTAALIFPAIARRDWCNAFRLSATLTEKVDETVLQRAVDDLRPRFPSFFVTLRRGLFWYYLEESQRPVAVREDFAYPLTFMRRKELRQNCLRVLVWENRVAVEMFHSLSDGRGGTVFLCSLLARYLEIRYGIAVPKEDPIRDLTQPPPAEEMEDSFFRYAAQAPSSRAETRAFRLGGTGDADGFKTLTCGIVDTKALLDAAHAFGVSVTAFLGAVMAQSIIGMQQSLRPVRRQKPVKITFPVDLRRLFPSRTLRNFSLVVNAGVDPRFGEYSAKELSLALWHQLCAGATRQNMAGMIASNVEPQQNTALRLAPVFLKNAVMNLIYRRSEAGGCLNISNLGQITLPEAMRAYVKRLDFVIGPQKSYPNNCSVVSFGGKTCINMIRNIRESELERRFFSALVELGVPVEIECNRR